MTAVLSIQNPEHVLSASPLPHLRRLRVTTNEHEVVITGRVPSYYLKQLAQEAVRAAVGRRRLLNRVEVAG
jgi:hypothetical protein